MKKFVAYLGTMLMLSNREKVVANKGSMPRDAGKIFLMKCSYNVRKSEVKTIIFETSMLATVPDTLVEF